VALALASGEVAGRKMNRNSFGLVKGTTKVTGSHHHALFFALSICPVFYHQ